MTEGAKNGVEDMVAAEDEFAKSARTSVRKAFLAVLAADAIVLAPAPTPGRALYERIADATGLSWYPSIAVLAGSGDLGFTLGPWVSSSTQPATHGYFLTVWRHVAVGGWRVAFDGGVSGPLPPQPMAPIDPRSTSGFPPSDPTAAAADARAQVTDLEVNTRHAFEKAAQQSGLDAGIRTYGRNSGFLLLADDELPLSWGAANDYWRHRSPPAAWLETAAGRSADGSLVFAVGEAEFARSERFGYAQLWQYDSKVNNLGLRILLMTKIAA